MNTCEQCSGTFEDRGAVLFTPSGEWHRFCDHDCVCAWIDDSHSKAMREVMPEMGPPPLTHFDSSVVDREEWFRTRGLPYA